MSFEESIKQRIDRVRLLVDDNHGNSNECNEAASLCQSVLYDTSGGAHPLVAELKEAASKTNYSRIVGICRTVVTLFEQGALKSPRLRIAHELEGDILEIAEQQAASAEKNADTTMKQTQLAIAAFLAGAALEDAMRRLCDAHNLKYDVQRTSLAKLQATLYQPANQIEIISSSENKQITAWGDTRNKADHGKFGELTMTEVNAIIAGTRSFIDRHLA